MARGNENIYLSSWVSWVGVGVPGLALSWALEGSSALMTAIIPKLFNVNLFTYSRRQKDNAAPAGERQFRSYKGWGAPCTFWATHAGCREADDHSYLIRSVCWFEQRPYAVKWKQKTKFSWAILLFLLQVRGHFTKAAQTRMSLVLKPQVNLPLFHMIKPDNCVLIANVVGEIQFLGPS